MTNFTKQESAIRQINQIVPRGTFERLDVFVQLLLRWNQKVNLISKDSESVVWHRHVLDSLQAIKQISQPNPVILDVGTGAGFPGLVLSIATGWHVILTEPNRKKCLFLTEAKLATGANVSIENKLVEQVDCESKIDLVVSRAVTDLPALLKLIDKFIHPRLQVIIWKGENARYEIQAALKNSLAKPLPQRIKETLPAKNPWKFAFRTVNGRGIHGTIAVLSNFSKL